MYLEKLQDVVDSVVLIREYHDRSEIKKYINNNFVYKNQRYVFYYFMLLNSFAPEFKSQYDRIFGVKPLGKKKFWDQDDIRGQIEKYVNYCYNSPDRLEHALNDAITYYTRGMVLTAAEMARIQALSRMPGSRYKADLLDRFLKDLQKRRPEEKPLSTKGIQGAQLTEEEKEQLRQVVIPITGPATDKSAAQKGFSDLGEPIPSSPPPSPDLETLQFDQDNRQKGSSSSGIQQLGQNTTSFARRVFTSGAAKDTELAAELGTKRAQQQAGNFLVRSLGSLGRSIISIPFGSGATAASRTAGTARTLAGAARGAGAAARGLGLLARAIPFLGVWGIVALAAPFVLFFGFMIFQQLFNTNSDCLPDGCRYANPEVKSGLVSVNKSGPTQARVGEDISYNLTVIYSGTGTASAEINDKVPEGTEFKNVTEGRMEGGVVKWSLKDLKPNLARVLTFTVTARKDSFWVVNKADIDYKAFPVDDGGIPPTQDNCRGRIADFPNGYPLKDSRGVAVPLGNFGDPACNFSKAGLSQQLQDLDRTNGTANATYWFTKIVYCETGGSYDPNSWRDHAIIPQTPDPDGAWGLFQMGKNNNPQKPFDYGATVWQQQTSNAVNRQRLVGWGYWACAGGR